jgi:RNA polymerase sigma-70 factor (ECF subfamily)
MLPSGVDTVNPSEAASGGSAFPQTRWSLVVQAAAADEEQSRAALEELCTIYWFPLYAYARRDGKSPEDAADLTQGFFAKLLSDENLKQARQERGKLRSYLLSAMRNFIVSQARHQSRLKRGGGRLIQSLDLDDAEQRYRADLASGQTPEVLYERRWAITLLDRALAALQHDYAVAEKAEVFAALHGFLGGGDAQGATYAETGTDLGMSEGAVKVAVHRMRKRYRHFLREEVRQTVTREEEIDDEIAHLFAVFA